MRMYTEIKKVKIKNFLINKIIMIIFPNLEIRQNEKILFREKEKLEGHIKLFKTNKLEFDNKQSVLVNNFQKFNNELLKFKNEKEIFNFEKKMFFSLNSILDAPKFIENIYDYEKFNENNKNLNFNNNFGNLINNWSVNDDKVLNSTKFQEKINFGLNNNQIKISGNYSQSHTVSQIQTSTPSSNGKKEISLDKSQNLNLQKSKIRERQVSRDKSNQNSFDINNHVSEKNIVQALGMNLNTPYSLNGVNNLNIPDNYNTVSNNVNYS
jgi:hypothetical protein